MWQKNVLWLRGGVLFSQQSRYLLLLCSIPLFYNGFSFCVARVNASIMFTVKLILWNMLPWYFRSRMHYSGQQLTLILKSVPFCKFCIPGSCHRPIFAQTNLRLHFKELLTHMGEHRTDFFSLLYPSICSCVCGKRRYTYL